MDQHSNKQPVHRTPREGGRPQASAPRPTHRGGPILHSASPTQHSPGRNRFSRGGAQGAGAHRGRSGGSGRGGGQRGGRGGRPQHARRQAFAPRPMGTSSFEERNADEKPVPPLQPGHVRIIPLGGVEEVGRNMTVIEYGNDIIVIDCGFQFREEDTPGIDYILPNTKYLEDRLSKIRGLFITHGHLDHIGGIPYVIDKIGYPPIFTRRLTSVMIKKRQDEFQHLKPLDIREVEKEETVRVGDLKVRFFAVTHTIPDSMGIIVETPYGAIVATGDLRLEHVNGVPTEREEKEFSIFKNMNVLMLMADSTNCEKPGFSIPESVVRKNLEEVISKATGRLIIGTFSSQLERIMGMIEYSTSIGKKILVEGRSMKVNIEIVRELGLLKVPDKTFIGAEELDSIPDSKVVILATGAQGDEFAALMRISTKTHKYVKIKKGDVVVLSSSIVPGNERAVQKLKDNLSRQGAKIIHRDTMDVHASGHANRDETVWIHQHVNPRFFMPMHGYHYMLRTHADIAKACGRSENEIVVPDNSAVIEIQDEGQKLVRLKEGAPAGLRLVDGFSIGDIQEVVIRDRKMMAEEGMFVIIATVNPTTGKLRKSPDIISRGFVYLRESQELLQQTRIIIKKTIEDTTHNMQPVNFDYVKNNVTDAVARFLFEKTNKRPLVIPVVLGV